MRSEVFAKGKQGMSGFGVVAALVAALFLYAPSAHAASTVTFESDQDAWVSADAPDANHGADTALQVDGSPVSRAYIRFTPTVPAGAIVTRTILRLHFPAGAPQGVEIRQTQRGAQWNEGTLTFNNAPSFPIFPGVENNIAAGWRRMNVLPWEPGNAVTYVLTSPNAAAIGVDSRETVNKPQLIVEYTMPSTTPASVCSATGCVESKPWIYTQSWATTIADFNGDGRQDHFVGRHLEDDQIFLQQADGSFAPGFKFPRIDRHTCAAGDLNSDGRIDLFCETGAGGGQGNAQDEVWIARPDGTYVNEFAAWGPVDPYGRGRQALLLDFDNDGLLDLYATSLGFRPDGQRSENILWMNRGDPGTGGSGFVELPVAATGTWGDNTVAAGDWNRDGYRDIAVGGSETGPSSLLHLFQNQAGTATVPSDDLLGATVSAPRDVALTDLNRDGWDDLVIVRPDELQVRLNAACASCARFSQVHHSRTLLDGTSVAVADITGDGWKDLYVVQALLPDDTNADDLLLAGPDWASLPIPQAETGTGDTAEVIDILGRKTVIVTNGRLHRFYSRGPVQFVSFIPNAPPPSPEQPGAPGAQSSSTPAPAPKGVPTLSKSSARSAAKHALEERFGKRFSSKRYRQGCKRLSRTRFRCRVSWTIGRAFPNGLARKRYAGTVSVSSTTEGLTSKIRITYTDGACLRRHGRSKVSPSKRCQKRYVT